MYFEYKCPVYIYTFFIRNSGESNYLQMINTILLSTKFSTRRVTMRGAECRWPAVRFPISTAMYQVRVSKHTYEYTIILTRYVMPVSAPHHVSCSCNSKCLFQGGLLFFLTDVSNIRRLSRDGVVRLFLDGCQSKRILW